MSPEKAVTFITWIPFVGWILPMALEHEDRLVNSHVKQAFFLAGLVLGVQLFLYLVIALVPLNLKIVKMVLVIMMYIVYGLYLGLAVAGSYKLIKGQDVRFPLLSNLAGKLDI